MSAHEHTDGPWVPATSDTHPGMTGIFADGGLAGCAQVALLPREFSNREANARLIAAAPDLLAALQGVAPFAEEMIVDACADAQQGNQHALAGVERWNAVLAAIARATGEAPEQASPAQLACQGEYFPEDAS